MALIVENGTGLADADAYISRADADAYHLAFNGAEWDGDSDAKDAAIRRATRYLDAMRWEGTRLKGRAQALDWPRYGATDCDGDLVPSDEVPVEVVRACALLAFFELSAPGALDPTVTLADLVKREKVDVIEVEYRDTPTSIEAQRPVVTAAMDMIRCLTVGGGHHFLERA